MSQNNGTPQRLYLMQLASGTISMGGRALAMSMGCYLVQTSDGQNILIDSGLPAEQAERAGAPGIQRGKNVLEQLADLDVQPADINLVIATHFDMDHAGYHDSFPQAEFVVQRKHYELARSGYQRFAAARPHWDHPSLYYRLVDGDTELLPGITLIETSGHTLGHQSVLVSLPHTGKVLLAIDAVPMQPLFVADRKKSPLDEDEEQLKASTRKLLELVERERVALVVFGHDGTQWATLRKAPEYYD